METYKASLDTTSKILTGFVFMLAIFGLVITFIQNPWYVGLGVFVIPAILLVSTYFYRVNSYQITNEKLIIKRPVAKFDKEILLSEIESVSLTDKQDFKWTVRTAGNGGLFGYMGLYANTKLGSFRMYCANRKNRILILIKNNKGKVVISPDDAGMVDVLQKLL